MGPDESSENAEPSQQRRALEDVRRGERGAARENGTADVGSDEGRLEDQIRRSGVRRGEAGDHAAERADHPHGAPPRAARRLSTRARSPDSRELRSVRGRGEWGVRGGEWGVAVYPLPTP